MAVDEPVKWHRLNLHQNPTHYSFLRYSGAQGVAAVQKCAGQVYYNTRVKMNGKVRTEQCVKCVGVNISIHVVIIFIMLILWAKDTHKNILTNNYYSFFCI